MYPTRVAGRTAAGASDEDAGRAEERRAVERVLAGDTQAYRFLVERHQRGVYAVIRRMVQSDADADDLAQQAFVAAYDALPTFDVQLRFSSWLYRIGVNLAKDHLKSKKRSELGLGDATPRAGEAVFAGRVDETDEPAEARERRLLLERALAKLSVEDREVLILKDIEELPFEELKVILGKPITALKIRAVRARARLREILVELAGEGAL
jgi:RNA polymerase sigma-70 factor (ECF subfamily)